MISINPIACIAICAFCSTLSTIVAIRVSALAHLKVIDKFMDDPLEQIKSLIEFTVDLQLELMGKKSSFQKDENKKYQVGGPR